MAKTFAVLSGKGGVGKSTFCQNIAFMLASLNKKVLLIDGDAQLRNLDMLLNLESKVLYDWMDVIENRCDKDKALLQAEKNIFLLPAPLSMPQINTDDIKRLIGYYQDFDYIFIDGPAGVGEITVNYAQGADETIVLVTPDAISVRTAYSVGEKLVDAGLDSKKLLLIVNKVDTRKVRQGLQMNVDEIIDKTYMRLMGAIPVDNKLQTELAGVRPSSNWKSYRPIYNIAQRIMGRQVSLYL